MLLSENRLPLTGPPSIYRMKCHLEHTLVRVSAETLPKDADRAACLAQSERRLREVWENDADDPFDGFPVAPNSRILGPEGRKKEEDWRLSIRTISLRT